MKKAARTSGSLSVLYGGSLGLLDDWSVKLA